MLLEYRLEAVAFVSNGAQEAAVCGGRLRSAVADGKRFVTQKGENRWIKGYMAAGSTFSSRRKS